MREIVPGMPTGLYVDSGRPPAVLIVQAYRAAGSRTLPVRGTRTFTLPAGTVLQFGMFQVTTAEDSGVTPGAIRFIPLVNPLPAPFAATATSEPVPDLLRVHGTSETGFRITTATADATSVISSSTWVERARTSQSWQLDRQGNFRPSDPAFQRIQQAARDGTEVQVLRVLPDEYGDPVMRDGGRALISDFHTPSPADGIIRASWVFEGQGEPLSPDMGGSPAEFDFMLNFTNPGNTINAHLM